MARWNHSISIFARMHLSAKALVAPVLFLIATALATALAVSNFSAELQAERRATLRAVNQFALAVLAHFESAERSGEMTREKAMAAASAFSV